jgi:hypothetical protein
MPRWIIVVLVVICLLWLAGVGMTASGDDGRRSPSEPPEKIAGEWFGGLNTLFPKPAALSASDIDLAGPCGTFPDLELPASKTCRGVVSKKGGRRRALIQLDSGRAELTFEPPQGKAVTQELETGEDERAELRFDDDGGALAVRCLSSQGSCVVRFVE